MCNTETLHCVSAKVIKCINEGALTNDHPVWMASDIDAELICTTCKLKHLLQINGFNMKMVLKIDKSEELTIYPYDGTTNKTTN